jgi:hypothetical protein
MARDAAEAGELEKLAVTRDVEFQELSTTIRHYGNLRFIYLPIYFAINGSMVIGLQNSGIRSVEGVAFAVALLATVLFWLFLFLEMTLNRYLEAFIIQAKGAYGPTFWTKRPDTKNYISLSIRVLYAVIFVGWLYFAYHIARHPSPSSCF